jgi:hypothetical protein
LSGRQIRDDGFAEFFAGWSQRVVDRLSALHDRADFFRRFAGFASLTRRFHDRAETVELRRMCFGERVGEGAYLALLYVRERVRRHGAPSTWSATTAGWSAASSAVLSARSRDRRDEQWRGYHQNSVTHRCPRVKEVRSMDITIGSVIPSAFIQ